MSERKLPCGCGANFSCVQYLWTDPEAWDGYSEKVCNKCERRYGRWSGKELTGNEREPRQLRFEVKG